MTPDTLDPRLLESVSLALRPVAIDTYHENVAYLHRECALYRAEGFQSLAKVEVHGDGHRIVAVLNIVDDEHIVGPGELGLAEQAFAQMGLPTGTQVSVSHAGPPRSMDAVRRKISGERLELADFRGIASDIGDNRYSKMEIAAFWSRALRVDWIVARYSISHVP